MLALRSSEEGWVRVHCQYDALCGETSGTLFAERLNEVACHNPNPSHSHPPLTSRRFSFPVLNWTLATFSLGVAPWTKGSILQVVETWVSYPNTHLSLSHSLSLSFSLFVVVSLLHTHWATVPRSVCSSPGSLHWHLSSLWLWFLFLGRKGTSSLTLTNPHVKLKRWVNIDSSWRGQATQTPCCQWHKSQPHLSEHSHLH